MLRVAALPFTRRTSALFKFPSTRSLTPTHLYRRLHVSQVSMDTSSLSFIDIGVNLLDEMYQGKYNGNEKHAPDLPAVLQRAWDAGVSKIIITAGNLEEARAALALARTHGERKRW